MKRLCFFAVLMALCSSASAGGSISFTVGGHRVHIESSRHCRSTSCASVSVSGVNERRSRSITDREDVTPARTAPPVPQTVSPPPAPATTPPAQTIVASPPAVYKPAASTTQIVAPPPAPPPPPAPQVSIPLPPPPPPPPPVAKPVEPVRPPAPVARVSHEADGRGGGFADRRLADRRQGHGADREMRQCAVRLCAQCILERQGRGDPDQHEAEDRPAVDRQRLQPESLARPITGRWPSRASTRFASKPARSAASIAPAITGAASRAAPTTVVTSRQVSAEPRS